MSIYPGEIRMFAGPTAPDNWAFCDGRILDATKYDMLYSMIGNFYGGDGWPNFALPDLRSRVPVGVNKDSGITPIGMAQKGGQENFTLTVDHLPPHMHIIIAGSEGATTGNPKNMIMAKTDKAIYSTDAAAQKVALSSKTLSPVGGTPVLMNMVKPYVAINFIILLTIN